MIALIQRVKKASVIIDKKVYSKINQGLLIFVGIHNTDTEDDVEYLCKKIKDLRIFSDKNNKMNLSIKDIKKEILLISQFTLYAKCKKGNRPSFTEAAPASSAKPLYDFLINKLRESKITTYTGEFGKNMEIDLINDGPVTIIINSIK